MSSRYERRRGSAGGAVLLLIAAAALVVAILAICTDIFSGKKAPDKDADTPTVTQTDGENTGDGTRRAAIRPMPIRAARISPA